jgi:UDP-N-acetylmuramate--alanine ligase
MRIGSDRVHLVGVGGAGMSALARLSRDLSADVTGSDQAHNGVLAALDAEGLQVWSGSRPERIHGENGYVVRSAAVPPSDPEVVECVRRGFTSLLYAEAVGRISEGKLTLAVAGTHGKTTTTALTVAGLVSAGVAPAHLVGGEVPELGGNGRGGKDDVLVVEACEFNRSFHQLRPFGAAILNVDADHFDCYPSIDDLIEAFAGYAARVRAGGTLFVEESVPTPVVEAIGRGVRVLRVGSGLFADLRAAEVADDLGRYSFVPVVEGRRLPRVQLSIPGRFQMNNALFALGLVATAGADLAGACAGIAGFSGVRRRFELHEGSGGGMLVNDYAHHPEEIRAVLTAARRRFPGRRLFAVFQPHQHQRTLHLLDEFAAALSLADECVVAEIYGARESEELRRRISAADLVRAFERRGTRCELGRAVVELPAQIVARRRPDDLVLILGAGDIDAVVPGVVAGI